MINVPGGGVTEVAEHLGWSADQVRAGLDELARLSLVRPSSERPGEFRPVPPEVGLVSLLARQEAELRRRQDELTQGRLAVAQLIDEYTGVYRQQLADVEQVDGIDAVRSRIEALSAECRAEIMTFAPGGAQNAANLRASRPLDSAVLHRGVRMRTLYQDSMTSDSPSLGYASWLVEQGAEVRTVPVLPSRMIIYDRTKAVLPLDPGDSSAGAVVVCGTGVVITLCELFERVWVTGRSTVDGHDLDPASPLTAQEQAVLRLLAQGHTDDAVARKLAVSVRTGRRITANLISRLGAKSRFQAGALAVQMGWLDPANPGC
ncbi:LuxR C-terminal-related transcriptional regulator [Amycolatopsis mediterranei]|uniref:helix-turn-helix transcriptional regulator n=1 Tax=Amycolatopsis mediterranei TaxID=33910 RepID=UPI003447F7DE